MGQPFLGGFQFSGLRSDERGAGAGRQQHHLASGGWRRGRPAGGQRARVLDRRWRWLSRHAPVGQPLHRLDGDPDQQDRHERDEREHHLRSGDQSAEPGSGLSGTAGLLQFERTVEHLGRHPGVVQFQSCCRNADRESELRDAVEPRHQSVPALGGRQRGRRSGPRLHAGLFLRQRDGGSGGADGGDGDADCADEQRCVPRSDEPGAGRHRHFLERSRGQSGIFCGRRETRPGHQQPVQSRVDQSAARPARPHSRRHRCSRSQCVVFSGEYFRL